MRRLRVQAPLNPPNFTDKTVKLEILMCEYKQRYTEWRGLWRESGASEKATIKVNSKQFQDYKKDSDALSVLKNLFKVRSKNAKSLCQASDY